MSLIGKIQTLFSDKDKTKPVFPRTKVSAVSDDNGIGLDAILDDMNNQISTAQSTADNAKTIADNAMPKSGGTFTGNIIAYDTNRTASSLRNIEVRTSSTTGTEQSTNKIIMVRK